MHFFEASFQGSSYELPTEVGRGGDQLVFTHPALEAENRVLKVSHHALSETLGTCAAYRSVATVQDQEDKEMWDKLAGRIAVHRLRYEALAEEFGSDHVPKEETLLKPHLLNGRTCRELWDDTTIGEGEARWFWLQMRWQEIVPALRAPEQYQVHGFHLGYPERQKPQDPESYVLAARKWLDEKGVTAKKWKPEDMDLLMNVDGNPSLRRLIDLADCNEEVRVQLKDFLGGVDRFYCRTGEGLDTNKDNIIFYQEPETSQWSYSLPDALVPHYVVGGIDMARSDVRLWHENGDDDQPRNNALANSLPFVRVTNALRRYLGMAGGIGFPHAPESTWRSILRNLQQQ